MATRRNLGHNQQIQVIPTSRFKNSYESNFFVRRQIAIKRLSVMMGFHPRLGSESAFQHVLSKDVTKWFLKKYVTPKNQCFVAISAPKVWITKELVDFNKIDVVFSDNEVKNGVQYFSPHFITSELVMYPMVIQTPKIGLLDNISSLYNGKIDIEGIFDPSQCVLNENFKSVIDMIDMRCKEWIFQHLRSWFPHSQSIYANRLGEHEYYMNFDVVNNMYCSSTGCFVKNINTFHKQFFKLTFKIF